ncbi:MAG: lytic transglycosylase domain-containing protein [Deltaproteobacteria bacterium]|nr:lytic transglycosylase domain-containing protein [Deltaproteobacteria bacterium]
MSEEMVLNEPTTASPAAPPKAWPRWIAPVVVTQLGFLIAFGLLTRSVLSELGVLRVELNGHRTELTELQHQTVALGERTTELGTQVQNLRQSLVVNSTEDVLFLKITLLARDLDPELTRTIARLVHKYAELYGRDPNLVLAMIAVESRFDPKVVSSMGAVGLMQVMPQWKKVLGIQGDLSDPEISIRYGLQILGFYSEMYQDLETALTAYNRGPGAVDFALMKGQDPRNRYAPRVLETYERLKKLTQSNGS